MSALIVLVFAMGCGSSTDRGGAEPSDPNAAASAGEPRPGVELEPQASAHAGAGTDRIPRCGAPETPELTSYLGVGVGDGVARHAAVQRYPASGQWVPADTIAMPRHHSTAIRWTNLDELPFLTESADDRLRFTFELLSRDVRQVPDQRRWWATYTARISAVCALTDDADRPVGVHVPNVSTPADRCTALEDAVEEAVREAARCTADRDCAVRDASACELRGLGCYWVAVRRDADLTLLEAAIRAYETSGCITSDCDCPTPPDTARCVDGTCAAP